MFRFSVACFKAKHVLILAHTCSYTYVCVMYWGTNNTRQEIKRLSDHHLFIIVFMYSFVDKFMPCNEHMRDGPSQHFTDLYVKNFGEDFGEEQMRELFLPFGTINRLVVMKDEAGQSKGFGFVSYDSHESAAKAVEELNGKVVGDREMYVSRAMKKSERNVYLKRQFEVKRKERQQRFQGVNLYIKNLEEEIDDAQLREEFNKFGIITSAKVCLVRYLFTLCAIAQQGLCVWFVGQFVRHTLFGPFT